MGLGSEPVGSGFFLNRSWHQFELQVAHMVGMQDTKETY